MGFGELIKSQVLTEYKADTSQMRREIKKLSKEQKKAAKEQLERMEEENRRLDDKIEMWGKVGLAIGATAGAYMAASEALDFYAKRSRLTSAAAGVDIGKLQKASRGLVSETRLLELSASAVNGTFKLSQQQIEAVVRGAVALRAEGKDLAHTLDRVQQAVTEGTVEPLKELGLVIKGSENDTQEGLNAAIAALSAEADKMAGKVTLAGDDAAAASVQMADAFDDLKAAAGELATGLTPIVRLIADMVGGVVRLGKAIGELGNNDLVKYGKTLLSATQGRGGLLGGAVSNVTGQARQGSGMPGFYQAIQGSGSAGNYFEQIGRRVAGSLGIVGEGYNFAQGMTIGGRGRGGRGGSEMVFSEDEGFLYDSKERARQDALRILQETPGAITEIPGPKGIEWSSEFKKNLASLSDTDAWMTENLAKIEAMQMAKTGSILSGIFGTPAEIEATAAAYEMLGGAFNSVAGAFGAGVGALIDGSASFTEAFKSALGESLKSMAIEMSIRSLRELAMGTAMLFYNPAASGAHFKAAGLFAAGAVAAGVGARQLGVGAPQAAAGAGAGSTAGAAGVGSSRGSQGPQSSSQLFLLGGDFSELPPGQREAIFRRKARRAGMTFEGDAVING